MVLKLFSNEKKQIYDVNLNKVHEYTFMTKTVLQVYPDGKQYVTSKSWISSQKVRELSKNKPVKKKEAKIKFSETQEDEVI